MKIVYEINTFNLEKYLDIPTTDDHYFKGINQQLPIGTSNGLAFINDGSGSVLKIQFVNNIFGKKEGTLTFTGMLGDVMKESVEVVQKTGGMSTRTGYGKSYALFWPESRCC